MSIDDDYEIWAADGDTLARIGAAIFEQDTRVTVRLPKELADAALAAWVRDDSSGAIGDESHEQARVRNAAGALALIGLSIEESGQTVGDQVVVTIEAWHVGTALDAAEHADLLAPLIWSPPTE